MDDESKPKVATCYPSQCQLRYFGPPQVCNCVSSRVSSKGKTHKDTRKMWYWYSFSLRKLGTTIKKRHQDAFYFRHRPVPSEKVYVDVGNILLFGTTCAMPKQGLYVQRNAKTRAWNYETKPMIYCYYLVPWLLRIWSKHNVYVNA